MGRGSRTPRTLLAQERQRARLSQEQLAEQTGVSLRTLQRLERGELDNPPVRYLVNCAIVLGVSLEAVMQPEWSGWTAFPGGPSAPPAGAADTTE